MKRPPKRNLQAEVEAFNARVKIGDLIEYAEVKGEPTRQFRTQTAASILSGHTPVVWLACKSGCVDIGHCLILPEQPAEASDSSNSAMVKVKLKFRSVEYHTIIREVPSEKIDGFRHDGELFDWLHSEFVDDNMPDSEIETDEFLLDHFETLPAKKQ